MSSIHPSAESDGAHRSIESAVAAALADGHTHVETMAGTLVLSEWLYRGNLDILNIPWEAARPDILNRLAWTYEAAKPGIVSVVHQLVVGEPESIGRWIFPVSRVGVEAIEPNMACPECGADYPGGCTHGVVPCLTCAGYGLSTKRGHVEDGEWAELPCEVCGGSGEMESADETYELAEVVRAYQRGPLGDREQCYEVALTIFDEPRVWVVTVVIDVPWYVEFPPTTMTIDVEREELVRRAKEIVHAHRLT